MPTTLSDLPSEVLSRIVCHLDSAEDLRDFTLTCKKFNGPIQGDFYRDFVKSQFPSFPFAHPDERASSASREVFWRDAVHGMTNLSRSWDRRSLLVRPLESPGQRPSHGRRCPGHSGQSMGFVPVIDSYQEWRSGDWASRKDVLALGQGKTLFLRSSLTGNTDRSCNWLQYCPKNVSEGRDDITALHLIPQPVGDHEQCIIGRASGSLERISLDEKSCGHQAAIYETEGRPVRSSAIDDTNSVLAACLSDTAICLYQTRSDDRVVKPSEEVSISIASSTSRTWTTHFLNGQKLAVGLGRSQKPIQVFDIGQHGRRQPVRELEIGQQNHEHEKQSDTSVYALAALVQCPASGEGPGDLFLSGAHDGRIQLHDLRCASTVVSKFESSVNSDAVYSLLPLGREKFVVGNAMHTSIRVFDLRLPGEKRYNSLLLKPYYGTERREKLLEDATASVWDPSTQDAVRQGANEQDHPSHVASRPWQVYLGAGVYGGSAAVRIESPIYCLARPSSTAPTIYAGAENRVFQIDILSLFEEHPDLFFKHGPVPTSSFSASRDNNSLISQWNNAMRPSLTQREQNRKKSDVTFPPKQQGEKTLGEYEACLIRRFVSWGLSPGDGARLAMFNYTDDASVTQLWKQPPVSRIVQNLGKRIDAAAANNEENTKASTQRNGMRRTIFDEQWLTLDEALQQGIHDW